WRGGAHGDCFARFNAPCHRSPIPTTHPSVAARGRISMASREIRISTSARDAKNTWRRPTCCFRRLCFSAPRNMASKKKTTTLLAPGADLILAAEEPTADWVERLGPAPGIYSREINYWLMNV